MPGPRHCCGSIWRPASSRSSIRSATCRAAARAHRSTTCARIRRTTSTVTDFQEEQHGQGRRQDRQAHRLPDADAELAQPRAAASTTQDRFWFAEYRGNKHRRCSTPRTRRITGMAAADASSRSLTTSIRRQERRAVDRRHDHRPRDAARSQDRRGRSNIRCRATPTCAACSSTIRPRRPTFWVGSNHGASIVKVEPLD